MPFPSQTPRPFTRASVEELYPNQTGCYGLFKQGKWVYVGKGDIRQRLLDHLNGDNSCIALNSPTHYVTALALFPDSMEKTLITELRPSCNQRVG